MNDWIFLGFCMSNPFPDVLLLLLSILSVILSIRQMRPMYFLRWTRLSNDDLHSFLLLLLLSFFLSLPSWTMRKSWETVTITNDQTSDTKTSMSTYSNSSTRMSHFTFNCYEVLDQDDCMWKKNEEKAINKELRERFEGTNDEWITLTRMIFVLMSGKAEKKCVGEGRQSKTY